jgi:hypothetical protein
MTATRLLAATSVVAVLASAGVATAAEAPVVSAQKTATGKAPVTVPGTGLKKGQSLPKGARIVYRDVTLEGSQKVRLTLKAPAGKQLRGLATRDGDKVGFAVVQKGSYVGQTKVQVRAFAAPKADGGVTGRIYALAR